VKKFNIKDHCLPDLPPWRRDDLLERRLKLYKQKEKEIAADGMPRVSTEEEIATVETSLFGHPL